MSIMNSSLGLPTWKKDARWFAKVVVPNSKNQQKTRVFFSQKNMDDRLTETLPQYPWSIWRSRWLNPPLVNSGCYGIYDRLDVDDLDDLVTIGITICKKNDAINQESNQQPDHHGLYMVLYQSHPHSIRIWDGSSPIFIHETQFKGGWISITFVASNMLSFQFFQLPSDKTCFAENKSPDEIRIFRHSKLHSFIGCLLGFCSFPSRVSLPKATYCSPPAGRICSPPSQPLWQVPAALTPNERRRNGTNMT